MLFSAVAEVDDRLIAEWDRSQNRTAAPLLEHGIGPSQYCSIKKPLVVQCLVSRPPGPPYYSVSFPGADAGFRVRGGASGVSRISVREVLKVRPIRKVGGWGGGGGAICFRSDTKSVGGGGGGIPLQVRYLWAHRKYLLTCYLGILQNHTRARMNVQYMPAKINLL